MTRQTREWFLILDDKIRVVGLTAYPDATAAILAANHQAPWPEFRGHLVVRSNYDEDGVKIGDGQGRIAATREGGRWSGPDVTAGSGYLVEHALARRGKSPKPSYRRTSSVRRHPRATSRRAPSELAGPMREVIYIFEREGMRGGAIWLLVLSCGHPAARKRTDPKSWLTLAQAMFRPLSEKLAPRRVQCHHCGSGEPTRDPALLVKVFGGEI